MIHYINHPSRRVSAISSNKLNWGCFMIADPDIKSDNWVHLRFYHALPIQIATC